jgi:hypothetical protein
VRTTVFDARDRKRYERDCSPPATASARRANGSSASAITAALAAPLDAREVAHATVSELVASTGADRAALYVATEDGDAELLYRHGPEPLSDRRARRRRSPTAERRGAAAAPLRRAVARRPRAGPRAERGFGDGERASSSRARASARRRSSARRATRTSTTWRTRSSAA